MEFDDAVSDDEIFGQKTTVYLKNHLKEIEQATDGFVNPSYLYRLKKELEFRDKVDADRLYHYSNFDQSDLRINFEEYDKRNKENAKVLARCHKDHIEIMARSWLPPYRYLENFIGCLNHESIHPIVDRILLEDGFSWADWDTEWMFYAGGMDIIEEINYIGCSPTYFLSTDAILNTMQAIPEYQTMMKKEYLVGDYDL